MALSLKAIKSIGNTYLNFMLGGGSEAVTNSVRHSLLNRGANNQNYIQALYTGTRDGLVRSHARNMKNGGFFNNFFKNVQEAFACFKKGNNSFETMGNFYNGAVKTVPLFLAVNSAISGVPNIYRAYRDKGVKQGLKETTRTFARMTTAALLGSVASGAIRLPLLCGTYAYMAGDKLGGKIGDKLANVIFGETYTEKLKRMKKEQAKEAKIQAKREAKELRRINKENKKLGFQTVSSH